MAAAPPETPWWGLPLPLQGGACEVGGASLGRLASRAEHQWEHRLPHDSSQGRRGKSCLGRPMQRAEGPTTGCDTFQEQHQMA